MTFRHKFRIHGDNIVECERALALVMKALDSVSLEGPFESSVSPSFALTCQDGSSVQVTFFPGFNRWHEDILGLVRDRGGVLREAPDVLITQLTPTGENPLLAIEYCAALPAGNQAWQRHGRAYSFALAEVPYLYCAELGGYELDETRTRRAARLPNPAIPFSFLSLSSWQSTPVLPVYVRSPEADPDKGFSPIFGETELVELVRALLLGQDWSAPYYSLRQKTVELIRMLASQRRRADSLTAAQWTELEQVVSSGGSVVEYLVSGARMEWKKTAYIDSLTTTAQTLMEGAASCAVGLTSSNLPMCLVPRPQREAFTNFVAEVYAELPEDFVAWLTRPADLAICWVMGFKPRGDDARPDRGLPPLTRMLIGPRTDLLTVVYGPAKGATWPLLEGSPNTLASQNGLWEVIMALSDAILVDSATDEGVTRKGYLRDHWASAIPSPADRQLIVPATPSKLGEHDVDTVLHMVFTHLGCERVFEGLCNPPGGDWSGISLQSLDRATELRWVSLPRVSGDDAKRPDHVLQLFLEEGRSVVLAIESKDTAGSVEADIGPRLKQYLVTLLSAPASVQRASGSNSWRHSARTLDSDPIELASAAAFRHVDPDDMVRVAGKANCDLVIGIDFRAGGKRSLWRLHACTSVGHEVKKLIGDVLATTPDLYALADQ